MNFLLYFTFFAVMWQRLHILFPSQFHILRWRVYFSSMGSDFIPLFLPYFSSNFKGSFFLGIDWNGSNRLTTNPYIAKLTGYTHTWLFSAYCNLYIALSTGYGACSSLRYKFDTLLHGGVIMYSYQRHAHPPQEY